MGLAGRVARPDAEGGTARQRIVADRAPLFRVPSGDGVASGRNKLRPLRAPEAERRLAAPALRELAALQEGLDRPRVRLNLGRGARHAAVRISGRGWSPASRRDPNTPVPRTPLYTDGFRSMKEPPRPASTSGWREGPRTAGQSAPPSDAGPHRVPVARVPRRWGAIGLPVILRLWAHPAALVRGPAGVGDEAPVSVRGCCVSSAMGSTPPAGARGSGATPDFSQWPRAFPFLVSPTTPVSLDGSRGSSGTLRDRDRIATPAGATQNREPTPCRRRRRRLGGTGKPVRGLARAGGLASGCSTPHRTIVVEPRTGRRDKDSVHGIGSHPSARSLAPAPRGPHRAPCSRSGCLVRRAPSVRAPFHGRRPNRTVG